MNGAGSSAVPPEVLALARDAILPAAIEVAGWAIITRNGWRRRASSFRPRRARMKLNLRNMWARMAMTRADVQTFHGMLRQIIRHRDGGS